MKHLNVCCMAVFALATHAWAEDVSVVQQVNDQIASVEKNIKDLDTVAVIDHARLAKEAGVNMPPSVLIIFSDPAVNTPLIKADPLLGLDLPHKVLSYAEPDATKASVAFADPDYLMKRHGLDNPKLFDAYQQTLSAALKGIPSERFAPVESVTKGYGIVELESDYPMAETITRIKEAVMSQGDTVWFGSVDFQVDAAEQGEKIPGATLLLFGGPKPGGMAMAQFPKLGLDAFCQKLMIYEDASGSVKVAFNDIVKFAELHYDGQSNKPQQVINGRLVSTFEAAVKKSEQK